ncbi:MAG: hypothetical protein NTV68_05140 [Methanomicrobiales archaeon]|nr:hypothetical protein [Methanomicrobiales archaeon]
MNRLPSGHLQEEGVRVDVVGEGGGWVMDLMANGRFNIGEDVRWSSFAKTFDVAG